MGKKQMCSLLRKSCTQNNAGFRTKNNANISFGSCWEVHKASHQPPGICTFHITIINQCSALRVLTLEKITSKFSVNFDVKFSVEFGCRPEITTNLMPYLIFVSSNSVHLFTAETPSDVHWRRFYFQLTCVLSTLELSGRWALQIYLLTYLLHENQQTTYCYWWAVTNRSCKISDDIVNNATAVK